MTAKEELKTECYCEKTLWCDCNPKPNPLLMDEAGHWDFRKSTIDKMKPLQEQWQQDMDKELSKQEILLEDVFNEEKKKGVKGLIDNHKQESLEEYIERETKGLIEHSLKAAAKAFIRYGAKWQMERSYSEEEVKNIVYETIEKFYKHFYTLTKAEMKEQWFEKFKKK